MYVLVEATVYSMGDIILLGVLIIHSVGNVTFVLYIHTLTFTFASMFEGSFYSFNRSTL